MPIPLAALAAAIVAALFLRVLRDEVAGAAAGVALDEAAASVELSVLADVEVPAAAAAALEDLRSLGEFDRSCACRSFINFSSDICARRCDSRSFCSRSSLMLERRCFKRNSSTRSPAMLERRCAKRSFSTFSGDILERRRAALRASLRSSGVKKGRLTRQLLTLRPLQESSRQRRWSGLLGLFRKATATLLWSPRLRKFSTEATARRNNQ